MENKIKTINLRKDPRLTSKQSKLNLNKNVNFIETYTLKRLVLVHE